MSSPVSASSDDGGEQATPIKTPSASVKSEFSPVGGSMFRNADRGGEQRQVASRGGDVDMDVVLVNDGFDLSPLASPIELAAAVRSATNNYFMLSTQPASRSPAGQPPTTIPPPVKMGSYNTVKYGSSNETTERGWAERWTWATSPVASRAHARWRSDLWRDQPDANSRWGRLLASGAGGPPPSWVPCCRSTSFADDTDDTTKPSPKMLAPDPVHGESFPKYTTGNHRSYLGGRIVLGPDVRQLVGSAVGICLPAPLVSIGMATDLPVLLTVLLWIMGAAALGTLFWTALSDPGIVTRRKEDVEVPENIIVSVELADIKGKRGAHTKTATLKAAWKSTPRTANHSASRHQAQSEYIAAKNKARLENRVHPYTLLWPFSMVTKKAAAADAQTLFQRRMIFAQHRLLLEALIAATHQLNIVTRGDNPRNSDIVNLATALLSSSSRFKNNRQRLAALMSKQVPLCSCGSLLVSHSKVRQYRRDHCTVIPGAADDVDNNGTTTVSTAQRGHHKYCIAYHLAASISHDSTFSLTSLVLDSVMGFTSFTGTYMEVITKGLPEGLSRRLRMLVTNAIQRMLAESGATLEDFDKGCKQLVGRHLQSCTDDEEDYDIKKDIARAKDNLGRLGSLTIVPLVAKEVPLRYCYYCCVYRGPRTHHCRRCQNCVDLFDHHCPWTGTCIGGKNYHPFLYFLLSLNSYLLLGMLCCVIGPVVRSIDESIDIADALLDQFCFPVILFLLLGMAGNTILSLLFYHFYIVAKGVTTLEHIRQAWRIVQPSGLAKSAPTQPVVVDDCETSCSDTSDGTASATSDEDEDTEEDKRAYDQVAVAARAAGVNPETLAARLDDMRQEKAQERARNKQVLKAKRHAKSLDRKAKKRKVKIRNVWSQGGTFSNCWSKWSGQIEPKVLSSEFRRVFKDETLLLEGADNVYADSDVDDPSPSYNGLLDAAVNSLKSLVLTVSPERTSPVAAVFPGNRYAAQVTTPHEFSDAEEEADSQSKMSTDILLASLRAHDTTTALHPPPPPPAIPPSPTNNGMVDHHPTPIADSYPSARYTDLSVAEPHGAPVDADMNPMKRKNQDKSKRKAQPQPQVAKIREVPLVVTNAERYAPRVKPIPPTEGPALTRELGEPSFRSVDEYSQDSRPETQSSGSPAPSTDDEGSLHLSLYSARSHSQAHRTSIVGREGSASHHHELMSSLHTNGSMSNSAVEMVGVLGDAPAHSGRRQGSIVASPQFMQRHSSLAGRGSQSGVSTPHLIGGVPSCHPTVPSPRSVEVSQDITPRAIALSNGGFEYNAVLYPDAVLVTPSHDVPRGDGGSAFDDIDHEQLSTGMAFSASYEDASSNRSPANAPLQMRIQTPPRSPDSTNGLQGITTVAGERQRALM